ncbi:alpha/beta fold hydrolase [Streptomyces sp. NPDC048507]|uniref:alpha/beta fold hydrolase n=1 Tax=Streptomyces sp. NPDC048507 TaxID=3365560 RepID=UPI003716BB95
MTPAAVPHRTCRFTGGDGIRLVAEVWGAASAPPLVLLHAGGRTRHSWGRTGPRLAALGWRVVAPDLRGHGDSEWPADGAYGLGRYAEDVRALVAALGGRPVLVGASLGGLGALLAAGEPPGAAVRALVLVDVAHRPDPRGLRRIAAVMRRHANGRAPWDPRMLDAFEGRMDPPGRAERLLDAACRADVPVLLVRGGISDVLREDAAAEFCARVPRARHVEVAGAGHVVVGEGEGDELFIDAVVPFLEELKGPRPTPGNGRDRDRRD